MNALTSHKQSQYVTENTPLANMKTTKNTSVNLKEQIKPERKLQEEINGDVATSSYVRGYN
ncbi:hypothetical protein [Cognaticolwellia beringensis]|uniref:Uncharacterized protein n=1 Tax=Cognaticolwellia beringensis TaxID=1967665 RepID=A0A222G6U2_9GAMM|nr:hypothetical protein [Cognaticolwellia beringensis]ASP47084.1 hypothetical protein B5D82_04445 [Cognaticolwellia beringensis]